MSGTFPSEASFPTPVPDGDERLSLRHRTRGSFQTGSVSRFTAFGEKPPKDLPATLALIRKFGIVDVELGDFYGRTAKEVRRLLDNAGLKASAMMSAHARLKGDIQSVVRDAHALGVEYVVCSTIPHRKHITAQDCDQAIEDFNRWGKVLADSKLRLCYHTHGVEFGPSPDGTLFDTLVKRTDPRYANYEMDIFWIVYAYQDPVKLLHKYPGRFPLMHVKDIRKDTPVGGSPGDVLEEASVILGQGWWTFPRRCAPLRPLGRSTTI